MDAVRRWRVSRFVMTMGALLVVSSVAEATTIHLDPSSATFRIRGQMSCQPVVGAPGGFFAFDSNVDIRLLPQTLTPEGGSYAAELYDSRDRLVGTATGTPGQVKQDQTWFARVVLASDPDLPVGTVSRAGGHLQVVVGADGRLAAGHVVVTVRGPAGVVVLQVASTPGTEYVNVAICSGRGVAEISIPFAVFP